MIRCCFQGFQGETKTRSSKNVRAEKCHQRWCRERRKHIASRFLERSFFLHRVKERHKGRLDEATEVSHGWAQLEKRKLRPRIQGKEQAKGKWNRRAGLGTTVAWTQNSFSGKRIHLSINGAGATGYPSLCNKMKTTPTSHHSQKSDSKRSLDPNIKIFVTFE